LKILHKCYSINFLYFAAAVVVVVVKDAVVVVVALALVLAYKL